MQYFHFIYIVEAYITLNRNASYKNMSPFSSLALVRLHLFFSIKFPYIGRIIS